MDAIQIVNTKLSYDLTEAAEATGHSKDVIRAALRRGDLSARYPTSKPVIQVEELRAWIAASPSVRRMAS